ncbi:hypothetical protein BGZ83_004767, partial [Gryganskiella cystojenkinii]
MELLPSPPSDTQDAMAIQSSSVPGLDEAMQNLTLAFEKRLMDMDLDRDIDNPWSYSGLMEVTKSHNTEDDEADQFDSDDEQEHINHSNEVDTTDITDSTMPSSSITPSNNLMDPLIATPEDVLVPIALSRVQRRKALREEHIRARIWKTVEDSLCFDPNLVMTANQLEIEEDAMITRNSKGQLVFQVLQHLFDVWLDRHQTFIGTSFKAHEKPKLYSTKITNRSRESKKEK